MIITFTTQNIDGMRKEWCFYSIETILKDWWTNDAEKLPSGDDPVLEVYIDNEMVSGIEDVDHLIRHLNILYWTRQELPESDIVSTINKLDEAFVEVESDVIRYIQIQDCSEGGYDYTLFDTYGDEIDGGQRETASTALMGDVLMQILDEEAGEYTLIRIMSEEEGEAILEGEYNRLFS